MPPGLLCCLRAVRLGGQPRGDLSCPSVLVSTLLLLLGALLLFGCSSAALFGSGWWNVLALLHGLVEVLLGMGPDLRGRGGCRRLHALMLLLVLYFLSCLSWPGACSIFSSMGCTGSTHLNIILTGLSINVNITTRLLTPSSCSLC